MSEELLMLLLFPFSANSRKDKDKGVYAQTSEFGPTNERSTQAFNERIGWLIIRKFITGNEKSSR